MKEAKTKIELRNFDPSGERFRSIHDVGSEEFQLAWLASNEATADAATNYTSIYDPATKEFLSLITLRVLQKLKARGMLKER